MSFQQMQRLACALAWGVLTPGAQAQALAPLESGPQGERGWRYVGLPNKPEIGATQFDTGSCLLYTSPSPRDRTRSRMPSSA